MGRQYREEIKRMREEKMTYQAIAETLGVTRQNVWHTAKEMGLTGTNSKHDKIIYVGVRNWIVKHKMSLHDFCIKCGEEYGSSSKTYRFLTGIYRGDINTIKHILDSCGLTFDEAFGEIANE